MTKLKILISMVDLRKDKRDKRKIARKIYLSKFRI